MKNIDKTLDTIHSIYIRLKYTDENGFGNCYTCDVQVSYKTGQCGHYIRRSNTLTRWSENDCRIQCEECNCFKDGLSEPFRDRLVNEFGFEKITRMEIDSHKPFKMTKSEKKDLLKLRRKQVRELLKEKNFNVTIP